MPSYVKKIRPWSAPIMRPGLIKVMASRRRFYCTADDFKFRKASGMRDKSQLFQKVSKDMHELQTVLERQSLKYESVRIEVKNQPLNCKKKRVLSATLKSLGCNTVATEIIIDKQDNTIPEDLELPPDYCMNNIDHDSTECSIEVDKKENHVNTCVKSDIIDTETKKAETERIINGNKADVEIDSMEMTEEKQNHTNSHVNTNKDLDEEEFRTNADVKAEDIHEDEQEKEENDEITHEQKLAIYEAVRTGDIDALEDQLDLSNADIGMEWYNENLLMIAIRHQQQEMAEFLLDNGIDHNYEANIVNLRNKEKGDCEIFTVTCRQMAYDRDMSGIVEIIDIMNNEFPRYLKPRERIVRLRRPPKLDEEKDSEISDGKEENELSTGGHIEQTFKEKKDNATISANTKQDTIKTKSRNKKLESENDSELPEETMERMEIVDKWWEECLEADDSSMVITDQGYMSSNISALEKREPVLHYRGNKSFCIRKKQNCSSVSSQGTLNNNRLKVNCPGSYNHESRMWTASDLEKSKRHSLPSLSSSRGYAASVSDSVCSMSNASSLHTSYKSNGSYISPISERQETVGNVSMNNVRKRLSVDDRPLINQLNSNGPVHLWRPNQRKY